MTNNERAFIRDLRRVLRGHGVSLYEYKDAEFIFEGLRDDIYLEVDGSLAEELNSKNGYEEGEE